jgi:hypothetical protein
MRVLLVIWVIFMVFTGCSSEPQVNDIADLMEYVSETTEDLKVIERTVETQKGAVVIYQSTKKNHQDDGNSVGIKYLEQVDGKWLALKENMLLNNPTYKGFGWNVMVGKIPPYIYYGIITNEDVTRVTIDGNEAEIIRFRAENDDRRFWFYLDHQSYNGDIEAHDKEGKKIFEGKEQ